MHILPSSTVAPCLAWRDMPKLLIVDGSNLLFQMFYGMPARIVNSEGRAIQGTLGFVGAFLKMARMLEATHAVAIFDGECENIRKEIDPEYKANRPEYADLPEEELPFSQLPDIYASLEFMGVRYFETEVCESDDIIAAYAKRYGGSIDVVIASQDSDFFQLISDKVSVLRYRGGSSVLCTAEHIREKLGVEPSLYADYKSLVGDTADNIRGAEKIGPKRAAALISKFGGLEDIIANAERIKEPSVRQSLKSSAERLRKNYSLIFLDGREELPFVLDELALDLTGYTTTEVLRALKLR